MSINEIKKHYDEKADDWLAKNVGNRKHYFWHNRNFIRFCDIKKLDKVLDVGCGIGTLIKLCYKQGAICYGIDLSKKMISNAKNVIIDNEIEYMIDNAEKTRFEDNKFDHIISSGVPEHTPNPDKFIKEMHRILKPNGFMSIQILGTANIFLNIFNKFNPDNFRTKNMRGKEFYINLFRQNGFKIIDIKGSVFFMLPYSLFPNWMSRIISNIHFIIEDVIIIPLFNKIGLKRYAYSFYIKVRKI